MVLKNSNPEYEWIEKDDHLETTGSPYDIKNQTDWWKQNCRIRAAFRKIELEVKKLQREEQLVSVRLVSWTRIAALSGCDRNTIKHMKRYTWTNRMRERLLQKINDLKEDDANVDSDVLQTIQPTDENLKIQLEQSRREVASWVDQFKEVEHSLSTFKRLANIRLKSIERLQQINSELSNRIAYLEDNISKEIGRDNVVFLRTDGK
jgi:hypothetical protein